MRLPPWLFPALALPAGVVLLQWHGIAFWQALTGSWAWGLGGSVTLEWLALWAWHAEARAEAEGAGFVEGALRIAAAGLITALLVAGPLYQVGAPLLREASAALAAANRADRTDAALETLKRASDRGRRVGEQIVRLTELANAAEAEAFGADAAGRKTLPGLERVLIGMHLAALAVFSVGCVAAVRAFGKDVGSREGAESAKEAGDADTIGRQSDGADAGGVRELHRVRALGGMETRLETDRAEPFRVGAGGMETAVSASESGGNGASGAHGGWDMRGWRAAAAPGLAKAPEPGTGAVDSPGGNGAAAPGSGVTSDPLAARVTAVLRRLDELYPGLSDAQRGERLPAGTRDISFLRNHAARVEARRKAVLSLDRASIERARVISEGQLARMETALGLGAAPEIPDATERRAAPVL